VLSDDPGLFALKRNASCIISVPPARFAAVAALCDGQAPEATFDPDVLQQIFASQHSTVVGPAWLGYADRTDLHGVDDRGTLLLTRRDAAPLRVLQAACSAADWEHSGIDPAHDLLFGCFHGPLLVAAGTCLRSSDRVLDIGVVTHPAYRGQGYGLAVVSAMTAYGLACKHIMRYRTLQANLPSVRTARTLGYQEYGLTIAVKPWE